MKRSGKFMAWSLLVLLMCSGCTGTPVTFPAGMTPSLDLQPGRSLAAEACGFQLLLFIPIMVNNRQERARQVLLGQAAGESVGEVKIQESWTYALVGTVYCTRLEAKAYPKVVQNP